MSNRNAKNVEITDVILRDAHQSLIATRMRTEDMLPICEKLDKVGYWSLEAWGGATFDACVRFLKEDPWERLRKIRAAAPNVCLQMLIRGSNAVGYTSYPDNVVVEFVKWHVCRLGALEHGRERTWPRASNGGSAQFESCRPRQRRRRW